MKNIPLFPRYLKSVDNHDLFILTNAPLEEVAKGERPLLIFNYGLVCNINHWEKQIPYFHHKKFHLLLHDYRGHYNSTTKGSTLPQSFPQMAEDLYFLLKDLKHPQVYMIGHSMGVNVTLHFAFLHPELIKGMVLISGTTEPPHHTMFDSKIMETIFPLGEALYKKFPRLFQLLWNVSPELTLVQQGILRGGFNSKQVELSFVQDYLKKIRTLPPQLFFTLVEMMKNDDIKNKIASITTATLLISGDRDKVIPIHNQYQMQQQLQRAELYIIKEGSHVPQVDFASEINKRMRLFFHKFAHSS